MSTHDTLSYPKNRPSLHSKSDNALRRRDEDTSSSDGLHKPTQHSIGYALSFKEDEFTETKVVNIYCATWNVNGKSPIEFVSSWLSSSKSENEQPADIYAIGFQELDDRVTGTSKTSAWEDIVKASIFPHIRYVKLKAIKMSGIMLIILVKEPLFRHITEVKANCVDTGILQKMGNKGGVAVRFYLHETSLCFVNSHLAHSRSCFQRRNQDYHDICSKMWIENGSLIEEHDMVYWFGDLNYRINKLFDNKRVRDMLMEEKHLDLIGDLVNLIDQLKEQQEAGKAFVGYQEGVIKFQPTYKYDIGTDDWDTSDRKRVPAWTDRILWKGEAIKQVWYQSHKKFKFSDHKPVSALFEAGIKVTHEEKRHEILNDVFNNFTNLQYKQLPRVRILLDDSVESNILQFGSVKFHEPVVRILMLENISDVPVKFRFQNNAGEETPDANGATTKTWLRMTPAIGTLPPNQKCSLRVQIRVGVEAIREITTTSNGTLSDDLVARIGDFQNVSIKISAIYKAKSFGSNIEELCKMRMMTEKEVMKVAPLEECLNEKTSEAIENDANRIDPENEILAIIEIHESRILPLQIQGLCNLLMKLNCFKAPDLFQEYDSQNDFIALRDWLDSDLKTKEPIVSVYSVAETLLIFLDSLCIPVIPLELYQECLEVSSDYNKTQTTLLKLPLYHKRVFSYIRQFLHEVLRYSVRRDYDEQMLAKIFGPIILREKECVSYSRNVNRSDGSSVAALVERTLIEHRKTAFMFQNLRRQ